MLIMNKILTILLCALLSSFVLHAQTQKGSQLLGGFISVGHTTSTGTYFNPQTNLLESTGGKSNSFGIGPSYTYFIADNLGLGGSLGYSHSHDNSNTADRINKLNSDAYTASLSLMKYFLFEKTIGIRTGPYAQYTKSTNKYTSNDAFFNNAGQEYKNFAAGLALDFVYFPVKKIGLVATMGSLGYAENKSVEQYNTNKQSSIALSFFNSASFSVYYAFGK
jgi:hypothetical protein